MPFNGGLHRGRRYATHMAKAAGVLPPFNGGSLGQPPVGLFVVVQHGSKTGMAASGGRGIGTECPGPSLRQRDSAGLAPLWRSQRMTPA
jgi:hypothetical protein